MKKTTLSQGGFNLVIIPIIILVTLVIVVSGYTLYTKDQIDESVIYEKEVNSPANTSEEKALSNPELKTLTGGCSGVTFQLPASWTSEEIGGATTFTGEPVCGSYVLKSPTGNILTWVSYLVRDGDMGGCYLSISVCPTIDIVESTPLPKESGVLYGSYAVKTKACMPEGDKCKGAVFLARLESNATIKKSDEYRFGENGTTIERGVTIMNPVPLILTPDRQKPNQYHSNYSDTIFSMTQDHFMGTTSSDYKENTIVPMLPTDEKYFTGDEVDSWLESQDVGDAFRALTSAVLI